MQGSVLAVAVPPLDPLESLRYGIFISIRAKPLGGRTFKAP